MSIAVKELEKNKVQLTVTVTAEDFAKGMDAAYRKLCPKINIPGFRKGKAPRKVIENHYGSDFFFEDAFREVYPAAYRGAVDESGIFPVDSPVVDIVEIGLEKGVVFTADVWVKPEVKLGAYKGVTVEKPVAVVPEEEVKEEIERARQSRAKWVAADRAVALGDMVTFDFAGYVDGVAFDGGTAKGYSLEIGSGRFIPGFEDQMVGMEIGVEKAIEVTFPEDYNSEQLKGKPATFEVLVHEVKAKQLPELDDTFAQDVEGVDTLDAYIASVRSRLEDAAVRKADAAFENNLVEACVKNATMDVPPPMVENMVDRMVQDMEYRIKNSGLSFEDYLRYTGQTLENVREQYQPTALERVQGQLVLEAIQKAEVIKAEESDIDEEIIALAGQTGRDVEEYKKMFGPQEKMYLAEEVLYKKTMALLKEHAVEGAESPPKAKKAKAKAEEAPTADAQEEAKAVKTKAATPTKAKAKKPAAE